MTCQRNGCGGTIESGYCDTCGMAPLPPATATATATEIRGGSQWIRASVLSTRTDGSSRSGSGRSGSRRRLGAGLVEVPPMPRRDPTSAVMAVAVVAEDKRYCNSCGKPVGRGRDGRPGRPAGFCPMCGARFDLTPKLVAGDLVGNQYNVVGVLAHGGLGWVYLATDKNVSDRWVVLKGLLNSTDEDATAAALAERRFLAEVEHPNIVKIYNFVEHDGAGYIVMEYVGGSSLKDILKERRVAAGKASPLPLAQALAYLLEIMPAFTYLHDAGLLFCDFKPDNVLQTGDQVKLIDLGGVVRAGDDNAAVYGTVGYQAPEIADVGPSIASDLYTVGRTLAVLSMDFRGYQSTFVHSLPERGEVEVFARHESYYRLLQKATHPDPAARFTSAAEMAEQMLGVLREVLAIEGDPRPAPSNAFTGELLSRTRADTPQWRHLPVPLVDRTDASAAFLASITLTEPAEVLALLATAPQQTIEVRLRSLRTQIEAGASAARRGSGEGEGDPFAEAHDTVGAMVVQFGNDWRLAWYDGILAIVEGDLKRAQAQFQAVYSCLPGELAPKLALGMALEMTGAYEEAAAYYDGVSRTDPSYTTAHAGLARCWLVGGDRSGAVEAYNRVPPTSAAYRTSQVAAVLALIQRIAGAEPEVSAMVAAAAMIDRLEVTSAEVAAMRAELLATALGALVAGISVPARVLGPGDEHRTATRVDERDLRFALEACYREMARAEVGAERIRLVDQANAVRPRTRL